MPTATKKKSGRPKGSTNKKISAELNGKKKKAQLVDCATVDGLQVCPKCLLQKHLELVNYNIEDRNGVLYFIGYHECKLCNIKIKIEVLFSEI
ncbi:MAG: hypothetical protein WDA59_00250 [Methanofastidiosum sp.]|jgi:hypothetical protein